jgi:hypothetical protein
MASNSRRPSRKRTFVHSLPEQSIEPRAKRLRSWKAKWCALLELPTEIRLHILKQLLWQQEPLKIIEEASLSRPWCSCGACGRRRGSPPSEHRQSTFQFSPAILRTCRTLHAEGIEVLYNNVISCEVLCDFTCHIRVEPYQSSFLRPEWTISGDNILCASGGFHEILYDPRALMSRVKRLDIVVRVRYGDECSSTRRAVQAFVQGTTKLPQLSEVTIHLLIPDNLTHYVDWRYENEVIPREDYRALALGPFAQMRGLRSVNFTGVSTSVADELTPMMIGDSPVVDLPKMYEAMRTYLNRRVEYGHCNRCRLAFEYAERADHEQDMEDEAAFKRSRTKVFSIIDQHEELDRAIACQYDPITSYESNSVQAQTGIDALGSEEHSDKEREIFRKDMDGDTDADREVKRVQEEQRPSLKRLREIVCREREWVYEQL